MQSMHLRTSRRQAFPSPKSNTPRAEVVGAPRSSTGRPSRDTEPGTPVAARYVRYPFEAAPTSAERVTVKTRMDARLSHASQPVRQSVRHSTMHARPIAPSNQGRMLRPVPRYRMSQLPAVSLGAYGRRRLNYHRVSQELVRDGVESGMG